MVDLLVNVVLPSSLYLECKAQPDDYVHCEKKKKKKKSTRRVGKTATALDFVVWAGQDSSGMDGDIEKFTSPADITLGDTHTLWSESHACVVHQVLPESPDSNEMTNIHTP